MTIVARDIQTNLKIQTLLKQKRQEIMEIAAKHGAKNVRIFGSVARGESSDDSDIDFLVDYDLEKITPWFPVGLKLEWETLLGRQVDVATIAMLKPRFREQILQEAIGL
jgi:uncharacterized protein